MSAVQAIKSFRIQQFKKLPKHVTPPAPSEPAAIHRLPNPFLPHKNPITGRWAPAAISRRRQAELIKKAKESGTLYLLPPGPKAPLTVASPTEALKAAREVFGGKNKSEDVEDIWMNPIEWEGKAEFKPTAGAELGTRLYARKKRMFKGHKWERVKAQREKKRRILLRDMDKRIMQWKSYYHRRKPNPLKSASSTKSRKLPF